MRSRASHFNDLLNLEMQGTPAEVRLGLSRLAAEVKCRLHRGSQSSLDFFTEALRLIARLKGGTHATLQMECLFDCASFFYYGGYSNHARKCSDLLLHLSKRTEDLTWKRKALTLSGIVHADMGNIGEALIDHQHSLTLARQIDDREGEIRELINTGVTLNYAGLYQEAIPCFRRAATYAQMNGTHSLHFPNAYINLAQSLLYLEQFEPGLEAAHLALAHSKEPTDSSTTVSRVVREFTFVQLALELRKFDEARQHAQICTGFANKYDSLRGRILSSIASGLCDVYVGDVQHGLHTLERALTESANIVSSRIVALIALVKACDQAASPQRALVHLGSLMNHIRAKRELGIMSLLMSDEPGRDGGSGHSVFTDLRVLELREARLLAQVANREATASQLELLERLAVAADLKEEQSGEHGYRVGKLCSIFAAQLGWSASDCHALELAARLHDIGKVAIPDRILLSSTELKSAERRFMASHTVIGAELLAKSSFVQLRLAEEIARTHHEWWDGAGYPCGLAGTQIPLHSRIVSLADVFDSLTHGRPYSPPWSYSSALSEIKSRSGTQFDPGLTTQFLALIGKLIDEHPMLDAFLGTAGQQSLLLQARRKIRKMIDDHGDAEPPDIIPKSSIYH